MDSNWLSSESVNTGCAALDESRVAIQQHWLTVFVRFSYDPRFAFQSAESLYAQECRNFTSGAGLRQFPSHLIDELTAGSTPGSLVE